MRSLRLTFWKRVIFFTIGFVALIILNLIWVLPTIQRTYSAASILALETAARARSQVSFSLTTIRRELEHGANEIAFEPEREKTIIDRILKYNSAIENVGIADSSGKEIFLRDRFDFISRSDLQNYAGTDFFPLALAGTANFGNVFISPQSEPHIILALPITHAGIITEVLVAEINLRDLVSAISVPEIKEGHIYVVDKSGYQVIHPDLTEILRRYNFLSRPIVNKVVEKQVVADGLASEDSYINEQGQDVFAVGMPVLVADLSIFFEQPRTIALAGVRQIVIFAIVTLALGAAFIFIMTKGNDRLQQLNTRLNELLFENDRSAKMLVRRDIELTTANTRLLELDKTKSEFVSIAAHQLRTPLTGLRWSYHALLEGDVGEITEDQKKILREGLRATMQMITLINDLLNVARIEGGRFGFTFIMQPIEPIIAASLPRFRKIAEEKAITLTYQPPPSPLPLLFLDAEKIGIVLDNLLDNGLKYTPPGGSVALRVFHDASNVHIEVRDSGIGISRDQIHRIFTKFFRATNAVLFQTSGNGLGLYVAKNIVEAHGGSMHVESTEGKGSVFTCMLPVKKAS